MGWQRTGDSIYSIQMLPFISVSLIKALHSATSHCSKKKGGGGVKEQGMEGGFEDVVVE